MRQIRVQFWLAASALLGLTGCSNELESPTAIRLKGLSAMYLEQVVGGGSAPTSEEAMKKHMAKLPGFLLEMNHVDLKDPKLFISDRDQEPFVFRWGTGISMGQANTPVLAHEKTGKNGKRLVTFADGEIQLVDEERFKKLTEASP